MAVTALVPWFGSNRMLAGEVGKLLGRLSWCGVPFAGGMAEITHIQARTIVVNDLHRHVINLARVVADDALRVKLVHRLAAKAFHPDELALAQQVCRAWTPAEETNLALAEAYFVASWMGRSHKCGIDDEFNGGLSLRWNASGGDSNVRYRSAVQMLDEFSTTLKRCTFSCLDAFEMLARCEDSHGHAIYCDSPFLDAGARYKHNAGKEMGEQLTWHERLRDAVERFRYCKVVMRFHDCPAIRNLYGAEKWQFHEFSGRTQANKEARELLLVSRCAAGVLPGDQS